MRRACRATGKPPGRATAADPVARGEHRERTPLYGVLMMIGAMVAATLAYTLSPPMWLRLTVYIVAVPVALGGFVFTFRDVG